MIKRGDPGYWEGRKKLGRPKNIKDAQQLWEYACEYFDSVDSNPFLINEQRRGTVKIEKDAFLSEDELDAIRTPVVGIPTIRPYTWNGFSNYLFERSIISNIDHYRYNLDNNYQDFIGVVRAINKIIYDQKFEGAAVGVFNSSIIARELGLTDKTQVTVKEEQPLFGETEDEDSEQYER